MGLLFINALKGLKKKKVQMMGIIVMVLLSTGIYTVMNTSMDRLEDRYYNYLKEQNVEYFSFSPVIDYAKDITKEDIQSLKESYFRNLTQEQLQLLNTYEKCLHQCDSSIYQQIQGLFQATDAYTVIADKKLDEIKDQYQFTYELERAKIGSDERYMIKAFPYQENRKINKSYLVEGRFPSADNEVTVLPNFAKSNHLKIGDTYKINDQEYIIVGYAYAPDHVYPLISFNVPIFDEKYNNIMFMTEGGYQNFVGLKDDTYVATFNYDISYKDRMEMSFGPSDDKNDKMNPVNEIFDKEASTMMMNMNTVIRIMRTDMLQTELNTDRTFANAFLYLLLGISVFIIIVITKKRIDDERLQIGVLKSLGYHSMGIAVSYLVYPILGSLIGGILGYLLGISLNGTVTQLYLSYFTVPLSGFTFNIRYLLSSIFVPMVMLSILSYFIALFMLRKKPLDLLKEGSNLKVNIFSKLITKVTSFLPFHYRFKYSLASRSLGKLLIVGLTSFCTGMLIVLILIGMNLFNTVIDKTFEGMKFDYMVSYNSPQTISNDDEDVTYQNSSTIISIRDKEGNERTLEKEETVTLTGIDQGNKFFQVLDEKEKDISSLLQGNDIIINKNINEVYEVNIGDKMVLQVGEKQVEYTIVGISESYMGSIAYVDRQVLCDELGLPLIYTTKYSNDDKYSSMKNLESQELSQVNSVFNLDDLENNVRKHMQTMNSMIYLVVAFASFMAFIIIAVIANIVVEENKKTISLMKVMGYKNKEITQVVLNIYTPVVLVAYLLSIPAMIAVLKAIVKAIVGDMNMALPITISPLMAGVGLLGLLVAYYIAIFVSKKALNKIPLAIALKRE